MDDQETVDAIVSRLQEHFEGIDRELMSRAVARWFRNHWGCAASAIVFTDQNDENEEPYLFSSTGRITTAVMLSMSAIKAHPISAGIIGEMYEVEIELEPPEPETPANEDDDE